MSGSRRPPAIPSPDWMLEQQMRAEVEAEAWRRLREEVQRPPEPASLPAPAGEKALDLHRSGSIILKALVRSGLGALGAYLAFIAAADAGLGEFEIWMAVGGAFLITLAATMFDPLRRLVHFLAETARWVLILGFLIALAWFLTHPPAA
jgi:hypothetical protein